MSFCVLIPAFNSERTLEELLSRVSKILPYRDKILVVDDGSKDKTLEIAESFGAKTLLHEKNFGKGEALKNGFSWAIKNDFDFVLTIDSDLQHLPEKIPNFLECQEKTSSDLVVGSRMKDLQTMPMHRRASNTITSFLLSIRTGQKIEDSQSGFRLYSTKMLSKIELTTSRYELESEILIKAGIRNFKISFIEIPTIYGDEKSEIRALRDISNFVKIYFKSLFW
ncbi:MAG: glycosyltransferase family 2 protein [Calditrichaeota bacterium]|nr:MAG: glycosyltransferase family 2 protein [Calditrichota bacterium]